MQMLYSKAAPQLFSFVTYRPESFGGFLFNPYLQQELPLSRFEFAVVTLCDGNNPVSSMPVELARLLGIDRATANRHVLSTLHKLERYYALRWRNQPLLSAGAMPRHDHQCATAPPDVTSGQPPTLSAPLSIIWEITRACNLNCLHCLSDSGRKATGELSTEEALSLIDELARLRVFSITVSGGEPLVRKDLFELLQRISEHNLCARLSTNGYGVTTETLRRLADLNVFAVQVSVDGLRDTHDLFRNHAGSYERAINALRLFTEAGFYTLMTTTANSSNLEEISALLDIAVELGVSAFKVGPYVHLGRAANNESKLSISRLQIKRLASILRTKERVLGDRIALLMDGLFPWLLEQPPSEQHTAQFQRCGPGCSAGISQVLVSYDGNVYPCPYIRSNSAGNVRQASLQEIWRNEAVFASLRQFDQSRIKGKCSNCPYHLTVCNGGCRGMAITQHHDLYTPDPNCWRGIG